MFFWLLSGGIPEQKGMPGFKRTGSGFDTAACRMCSVNIIKPVSGHNQKSMPRPAAESGSGRLVRWRGRPRPIVRLRRRSVTARRRPVGIRGRLWVRRWGRRQERRFRLRLRGRRARYKYHMGLADDGPRPPRILARFATAEARPAYGARLKAPGLCRKLGAFQPLLRTKGAEAWAILATRCVSIPRKFKL